MHVTTCARHNERHEQVGQLQSEGLSLIRSCGASRQLGCGEGLGSGRHLQLADVVDGLLQEGGLVELVLVRDQVSQLVEPATWKPVLSQQATAKAYDRYVKGRTQESCRHQRPSTDRRPALMYLITHPSLMRSRRRCSVATWERGARPAEAVRAARGRLLPRPRLPALEGVPVEPPDTSLSSSPLQDSAQTRSCKVQSGGFRSGCGAAAARQANVWGHGGAAVPPGEACSELKCASGNQMQTCGLAAKVLASQARARNPFRSRGVESLCRGSCE